MLDLIGSVFLSILITIFTAIMAIAGVGAAFIDIPLMKYFGINFLGATAVGLLLNFIGTGTASIRHYQQKVIDFPTAVPIIVTVTIFTPIGAYVSGILPIKTLELLFALFLLLVGFNFLQSSLKQIRPATSTGKVFTANILTTEVNISSVSSRSQIALSMLLGAVVGFISGLLGVGGGSIILPFLLWLGMDIKRAGGTTSFIVVFNSLVGFISKLGFTSINLDPSLILLTCIGTIIGAWIGSYLMHFKLNKNQIKFVISLMLLLVAINMGVTAI